MVLSHSARIPWICRDGTTVQVPAGVMRMSSRMTLLTIEWLHTGPVYVPIPGWIIHRLLIWLQRFRTYKKDNMWPDWDDLDRESFHVFDYDLDDSTLLDLLVLKLSSVYLRISRLEIVTNTLIENRVRGRTQYEILNMLGDYDEGHLDDYHYLLAETDRTLFD